MAFVFRLFLKSLHFLTVSLFPPEQREVHVTLGMSLQVVEQVGSVLKRRIEVVVHRGVVE